MDTTEVVDTINNLADIIQHLADYAHFEDAEDISKARAAITQLVRRDRDTAESLWAIAIKLQRLTQTQETQQEIELTWKPYRFDHESPRQ